MRDPKNIDPIMRAAVLAWARAPSLKAANRALAKARAGLDARRRDELCVLIAELSAESLLALLEDRRGTTGGETFEVFGLELEQVQIERFVAWARDQRDTADALGIDVEIWSKQIERAIITHVRTDPARAGTTPPTAQSRKPIEPRAVGDLICNIAWSERTFGRARPKFENRPTPGSSAASGLRGLLNARSFKN